jgi:hypothetical protein
MSNENQHWVPKFLVKNFADADGRVFCLNIQTDEITKPPPKYAAASVGFNEFVMDGKIVSFEDRLEKIETLAAPIIKQIVNSRSVAWLTKKQRNRVGDFMAAQSFRTEAFYKGMELRLSRQRFGTIFAQLWRSAFLASANIVSRKWVVTTIDHDDVFYLGDHPVVLQNTANPSSNKDLGIDIEGVEALLPLAPKCALYMPCAATSREIISGYEKAVLMPERVRMAVLSGDRVESHFSELLHISQRLIRNSRPLYQALTTGVPLVATPENVENLNYLQCAWAHRAIYSDRGGFVFAKRVFHKSPQYRNTVKVRLAMIESDDRLSQKGPLRDSGSSKGQI